MDSTNNNVKGGKEIDIRDAIGFLFSKLWIIALITACAVIVAFLITSFTTEIHHCQKFVDYIKKIL